MRSSPVFFRTKRIGWPYGELLGRIQPFSNKESSCFRHSTSSAYDIRYCRGRGGWLSSSMRSIRWVTSCSGMPGDSNTSENSSKSDVNRESPYYYYSPRATRKTPNHEPLDRFYRAALRHPRIVDNSTLTLSL